ncbi:hypothetical protein [Kitasatospora purpeofusca]|uniref:hypothetical protein n=1 Tax=Kitasatospora purpeofusca TaxID=67352 RepID=UPI003809717E
MTSTVTTTTAVPSQSAWADDASWPEEPTGPPVPAEEELRALPPRKPRVDITNEAESFERLLRVMSSPDVPRLYVRSGGLNWITSDDKGEPSIHRLNSDNLLSWFAEHVETFAMRPSGRGKNAELVEVRQYPSGRTCSAILGREKWRLSKLAGVVTAPVLREDGTLLEQPGFDPTTGLFLFPRLSSTLPVPAQPTTKDVEEARNLLLLMLSGFPWVAASDQAQYLALALAPILRHSIPCPTPMGLITATTMGSGKSYLTFLFERLYGMGTLPWPRDNSDELRKAITTKLTQTGSPAICFDNVDNGGTLKSPLLADLLTKRYWEDRILGSTANIGAPNDRLWLATGNNLRTGGDMSRRVLWVRLDPDCPNPDQRDNFAIGDFVVWVRKNDAKILRALLVLVLGWVQAGSPLRTVKMGGYSEWATAMAGLLDWAGIPGFMADRASTSLELDEEVGEWHPLLATWYRVFGNSPKSTKELLQHSDINEDMPLTNRNERPVPRQLGQWLNARMGRYYGEYRVVRHPGPANAGALWSVSRLGDKKD